MGIKMTVSRKSIAGNGIILTIAASSFLFYASSTGITGVTKKSGSTGCVCHGNLPSETVNVIIIGPDELLKNETGTYSVTITGGPLARGGTNIATSAGILNPGEGLRKANGELTHTSPKAPLNGVVTFNFSLTAPETGDSLILYANGNSVNNNGADFGDQWSFAQNKIIRIKKDVIPVELSSFIALIEGNSVILKWTTATEVNNSGFEVQRTSDNINWDLISFIKGSGSTTQPQQYSFEDRKLSPGIYKYRLKQLDYDGTNKIYNLDSDILIAMPEQFVLKQNYPNPFNPLTNFGFSIASSAGNAFVDISLYDILGEKVASILNEEKEPGEYEIQFNAGGLASGIYYYAIIVSSHENKNVLYNEVKKMILLK